MGTARRERPPVHGLLAEFTDPDKLLAAAVETYEAGYRNVDGYSPFPIEGLAEAVGFRKTRLPLAVLVGGILGCAGGYLLQYWTSVIAYPINIGGRPLHSWPSFIPVTFETTVLIAAATAVLGMLLASGLPRPHHPVFNVPRFEYASRSLFFLCIEATDPQFDMARTREFLQGLGAVEVHEVPH